MIKTAHENKTNRYVDFGAGERQWECLKAGSEGRPRLKNCKQKSMEIKYLLIKTVDKKCVDFCKNALHQVQTV